MATRTWSGATNSDLNNPLNYSGSGALLASDDLVFSSGSIAATASADLSVNSISTTSGYSGNWGALGYNLTVALGVTFAHTGTLTLGNSLTANGTSSTVSIGSGVGTVDTSTCAFVLNGTTGMALTFNKTGVSILSLTLGTNAKVTYSGSTLQIYGRSTLLILGNGATWTQNAQVTFYMSLSAQIFSFLGSYTWNGSGTIATLTFNAIEVITFPAITYTGSGNWSNSSYPGTWSLAGDFNIGTNALTINSGLNNATVLYTNNYNITCGALICGKASGTGSFTAYFGTSAVTKTSFTDGSVGGTYYFSSSIWTTWTFSGGSTVTQTVARVWSGSVSSNMNDQNNYSGSGALLSTDNLVFNTGSVNATASAGLTVASISTTTGYSGTVDLASYSHAVGLVYMGGATLLSSSIISCTGNWTFGPASTITPGTSSVTFSGVGTSSVISFGKSFYDVTVNNASKVFWFLDSTPLHNLTTTAFSAFNSFSQGSLTPASNTVLTVSGNILFNGSGTLTLGNIVMTGNNTTWTNNVTSNGQSSAVMTFNGTGITIINNVSFRIMALVLGPSASVIANGTAEIGFYSNVSGIILITLGANSTLTNNCLLDFFPLASSITLFSYGGSYTWNGTGGMTITNIAAQTVTIPGINYTGTGVFTCAGSGTYATTYNVTGDISVNNLTFSMAGTTALMVWNFNTHNVTCVIFTIGSTMGLTTGSLTMNYSSGTFTLAAYRCTGTGGAGTVIQNFNSSTWNCSGNWIFQNTHIINPGTSTVNFLNNAVITPGGQSFNSLVFNGVGKDFTIADNVFVNSYTITAGTINQGSFNFYSIASVNIWSAPSNGNWNTVGNWSLGHVPTSGETVLFNGTSIKNCTFDVSPTVTNFYIEGSYSGAMTLAGQILTLSGNFIHYGQGTVNFGNGITMNGNTSTFYIGSGVGTITASSCSLILNGITGMSMYIAVDLPLKTLTLGASAKVTTSGVGNIGVTGTTPFTLGNNSTFTNNAASLTLVQLTSAPIWLLGTGYVWNGSGSIVIYPGKNSGVISVTIPTVTYTGTGNCNIADGQTSSPTCSFTGDFNIGTSNLQILSGYSTTALCTWNFNNNIITCGSFNVNNGSALSAAHTINYGGSTFNVVSYSGTNTTVIGHIENFQTSVWNCAGNWLYSTKSVINPGTSTVNITNTSTITANGQPFYTLILNAPGKVFTLASNAFVDSYFVTAGTLAQAGYFIYDTTGLNVWSASSAGNWNTAGNWSLGHVPTSGESVLFSSASVNGCTFDVSPSVVNFYIESSYTGAMTMAGQTLTLSGDFIHYGLGTINLGNGITMNGNTATLAIKSTVGTVTATSCALIFNGTIGMTLSLDKDLDPTFGGFKSITLGTNAYVTVFQSTSLNSFIFRGATTVGTFGNNSTFIVNHNTVGFTATATQSLFSFGAGVTFAGRGSIVCGQANGFTPTVTIPAVTYTGTGAWSFVSVGFNDNIASKFLFTGSINLGTNNFSLLDQWGYVNPSAVFSNGIIITCGTFIVSGLSVNFGNSTYNCTSYATGGYGSSSYILDFNGSTWNCSGSWTYDPKMRVTSGTSTVNITGTSTITSNFQPFYNLTLNATGKIITLASPIIIDHTYNLTAGTLAQAGYGIYYSTGANIWAALADGNWNTAGNWSLGHVPTSGETVLFSANSIKNCTFDVSPSITNLYIEGSYSGTLTMTGQTLILSGNFLDYGSGPQNFGNGITLNGNTSIFYIGPGVGAITATSCALTFNGTGTILNSATAITFMTLTVGNSAVVINNSTVALSFASSTTPLVLGTSATFTVNKLTNFYINGSVHAHNLGSGYTINGSGSLDFLAAATTVTFDAITLSGTVSLILEENANSTVNQTGTISVAGTLAISAQFNGNFTFNTNDNPIICGTFNLSESQVNGVEIINLGASTINCTNVSISPLVSSIATFTLHMSNCTINCTGNFSYTPSGLGAKIFDSGTSTVNITGTSTITANGNSFYNLVLNGSGKTFSLGSNLFIHNSYTLTAGTLNLAGYVIYNTTGANIWSANSISNWNNAGNWSLGHVPTSGETVLFNATSVYGCTVDINPTITNLWTESSYIGAFTMVNQSLTLSGDFIHYATGTSNLGLGITFTGNTSTCNIASTTGTKTVALCAITYTGNNASWIENSGAVTYYSLTVSASAKLTVTAYTYPTFRQLILGNNSNFITNSTANTALGIFPNYNGPCIVMGTGVTWGGTVGLTIQPSIGLFQITVPAITYTGTGTFTISAGSGGGSLTKLNFTGNLSWANGSIFLSCGYVGGGYNIIVDFASFNVTCGIFKMNSTVATDILTWYAGSGSHSVASFSQNSTAPINSNIIYLQTSLWSCTSSWANAPLWTFYPGIFQITFTSATSITSAGKSFYSIICNQASIYTFIDAISCYNFSALAGLFYFNGGITLTGASGALIITTSSIVGNIAFTGTVSPTLTVNYPCILEGTISISPNGLLTVGGSNSLTIKSRSTLITTGLGSNVTWTKPTYLIPQADFTVPYSIGGTFTGLSNLIVTVVYLPELVLEPGSEYDFPIGDTTTIIEAFTPGDWSGTASDPILFNSEDGTAQAAIQFPNGASSTSAQWSNMAISHYWGASLLPPITQIQSGQFIYTIISGNAQITGYTGSGAMIIPSTLGGYPVTSIADYAFIYRNDITSVAYPNSLTSMGNYSFNYCSNLNNVSFGSGLSAISTQAFYQCYSLTNVTLPSNIGAINNNAFFQSGLTTCNIPKDTTNIGSNAFFNDSNLIQINVDSSNPNYYSDSSGVLFNKDKSILIQYPLGKTGPYTIDATDIGAYSFAYAHLNNGVTILSDVTSIETAAFYFSLLPSITIPASVINIGLNALYDCTRMTQINVDSSNPNYSSDSSGVLFDKNKLTLIQVPSGLTGSYTIPNTVTSFNSSGSFYESYLSTINIPASVTNISSTSEFFYCPNLNHINVDSGNTTYASDSSGVLFNKAMTTLYQYPTVLAGSYVIPSTVTSIANYAFRLCTNLNGVTIPSTVTTINNFAFYQCSSLTSVYIPATVTSLGALAFNNWPACTQINVDSSNPNYSSDSSGVLFDKNKLTLLQYPTGRTGQYVIPSTVTSIAANAFQNCTGLTSITIPPSVTIINGSAFFWCTGLTSITIPSSVTVMGTYIFQGCTGLTNITLPSSLTSVINGLFYLCTGLKSVTLPATITTVGANAFFGCSNLTSIYFLGDAPISFGTQTFSGCPGNLTAYFLNTITNGWSNNGTNSLTNSVNITSFKNVKSIGFNILTDLDSTNLGGNSGIIFQATNQFPQGLARDGSVYTSVIDTSTLVGITNFDPYFDIYPKFHRVDAYYTNGRETKVVTHWDGTGHTSWSPTSNFGIWEKTGLRCIDKDGAVLYLGRDKLRSSQSVFLT